MLPLLGDGNQRVAVTPEKHGYALGLTKGAHFTAVHLGQSQKATDKMIGKSQKSMHSVFSNVRKGTDTIRIPQSYVSRKSSALGRISGGRYQEVNVGRYWNLLFIGPAPVL